ncbi:MAG: hypothetical protein ACWGNK_07560, partial [Desulfobacterales bacterium]
MEGARPFSHHAASSCRSTSRMIIESSTGGRTGGICCMISGRSHILCKSPLIGRWTQTGGPGSVRYKRFISGFKRMPSLSSIPNLPWSQGTFPVTLPRQVYLVGGSVRDLLLGRRPLDLDLAVVGNPRTFAQQLADHTGGRL